MAKGKKTIDFGEFSEHIQVNDNAKKVHELLDQEKDLIIKDYMELKKVKQAEDVEEKAISHFEKKLKELMTVIAYLEGYVEEIEAGNALLKHNNSVRHLGEKLSILTEEVKSLSKSILGEEEKMVKLAKHIQIILGKAKKIQDLVFA